MMITCYSQDLTCTSASPSLLTACQADLFFPITNEGNASSISCSQIHSSFNPFGVAVHTCPVILRSLRGSRGGQEVAQRLTDFSQCTFSTDANRHVVLVRIYRFIEGIYPLYLAEQDTSFIMSQVLHAHTHTQMYSMSSVFHVQCIPCPVYSMSSVFHVQCIPCPVYSMSSVFHVQCIPCPVYSMSSVFHVQCIPCPVYSMSSVFHVQCIPCPVYSMSSVFHVQRMPCPAYAMSSV